MKCYKKLPKTGSLSSRVRVGEQCSEGLIVMPQGEVMFEEHSIELRHLLGIVLPHAESAVSHTYGQHRLLEHLKEMHNTQSVLHTSCLRTSSDADGQQLLGITSLGRLL